jgi:deoxyribonuclease-4
MPLLGAHMSISGGLERAFLRGKNTGCRAIQIFTRNPTQWKAKPLSSKDIEAFKKARRQTSIEPVSAHDSYLINLASPRSDIREKSLIALAEEMDRADALGIPYLVMHPGAHLGEGEKIGLRRISEGLNSLLERRADAAVKILLETTAGQGTNLGYRFEHLAEIFYHTGAQGDLGICLDTCHLFAAGYDFRTPPTYSCLMQDLDSTIGLGRLKVVHVNDAKKGLGSKVDRHAHPGRGFIGKTAFSLFLQDPLLKDLPFLIETPKGRNQAGEDWDAVNLRYLESLMERRDS